MFVSVIQRVGPLLEAVSSNSPHLASRGPFRTRSGLHASAV